MSSAPTEPRATARRPGLLGAFGLRIAGWYAALFIAGGAAIIGLTYQLTSTSLTARDRQIIGAKLGQYAAIYQNSGLRALAATVQAEQSTAPEHIYVRVYDQGHEALILGQEEGWDPDHLEVGRLELGDGVVVEVGKSTEGRDDVLARFRAVLGVVALSIALVAFTGGWLATETALRPIRALSDAVQRVIRTGRTDARVPLEGYGDDIDELTTHFNTMLGTIEGLVQAMRGTLDNVSHDLRTPLTRLRGMAETALAGEPDPARYREALADCVEECDRVLAMLNTLMDISEAESGAMPLARESLALDDVVARAVDLYRDVADARDISLVHARDPQAVVSADRTRLEQVVANLIDNALKYTADGGRVTVSTGRDAERAWLRVTDTGRGIAGEDLPRIFERGFRGSASRTERGLGLGLSLVKAVVEAHGGSVEVSSAPGEGTAFTVRIG
mgnify:CR=1 FL=1